MSNLSNQTGNINIQHPERWTLQLALHPRVLRYLLFDRQVDNSLIAGEIPLDTSASTYLKAVENAIYDNSPLLDDYGNVRLLVDTTHFVLLPNEVADEAEADELLHLQFVEHCVLHLKLLLQRYQIFEFNLKHHRVYQSDTFHLGIHHP